MLKFCERAKVIGISATATVPSVIGNYDMEYLKSKMQDFYVEVSEEEKQRLADSFQQEQEGYKILKYIRNCWERKKNIQRNPGWKYLW